MCRREKNIYFRKKVVDYRKMKVKMEIKYELELERESF